MAFLLSMLMFYQGSAELYRPYELKEIKITETFIYVAPFEASRIYQYDLEGKFIQTIGQPGQGPGEFELIALVGKNGENILAASLPKPNLVFEFSPEGKLINEIRAPDTHPFWPYRIHSGWLLSERDEGSLSRYRTDLEFNRKTKLIAIPLKPTTETAPEALKKRRILWALSRNQQFYFLIEPGNASLTLWDFKANTKRSIPIDVDPIPSPIEGAGDLPLFENLFPGPQNTCLVYTSAHVLHDQPPLVIDANGKTLPFGLSPEVLKRLIEIRRDWAWLTTYDEEAGAGIAKVNVTDLNSFAAKHPIHFTEEDMNAYRKSLFN